MSISQSIHQALDWVWKPVIIGVALFLLVQLVLTKRRASLDSTLSSSKPEISHAPGKNPPRQPGQWIASSFQRPRAAPYPDWSLQTTKPLPYRPFKWGSYYITMGLRSMPWDEWIELDNRFLEYHSIKRNRILERGSRCNRTAPEAIDGACELLEELASYLPERYPQLYRRTEVGLDNIVTGESFNVAERPLKEDPMQIAARLVQDDLAIMFERADGQYYLLAGSILLPGFWRLEDKFGMPLAEIHTSGDVPGFKDKLQRGMENFFRRLAPDKPVIRHNYFFQVDDNLAWSESLGSEDQAGEGGHFGWGSAVDGRGVEHHRFRSERQTLRRLPRSGGVVFTIRTYFEKVTEIAQEPGVPGRLASGVRGWPESVDNYKGREKWGAALLEFLDAKHQEQRAQGLVGDEAEHERYPY